ncbi:MAG TPA: glycosyltransferase family 2 protein [Bacteroidota bacterium]|jgi:GT2 family glycosyltransferase
MSGSSPAPDVSIVFANWNTRDYMRDCLLSIREHVRGLTYEIIVVDDGSTDGSPEMLAKEFPEVTSLVNERNLGVTRTYNRGVARARGRYIQIMNTDMILVDNSPKILMEFLETHPDAAACGAWLRNRDMTSQVTYGVFPSFHQALVDAFFLNDLFPRAHLPNRGALPDESITEPMEVDYTTGASMMTRKSVVDRLGFFDETFTSYCEDTDFCYRVKHEAHMKTYFVPAARIIHFGGVSFANVRKRQIRLHYSSYDKFLTKHHGAFYSFCTRALYAWQHGVKLAVRFVRYLAVPPGQKEKKEEKKSYMLNAWYIVRYSLAPSEEQRGS